MLKNVITENYNHVNPILKFFNYLFEISLKITLFYMFFPS